jgi:hypothetical protein
MWAGKGRRSRGSRIFLEGSSWIKSVLADVRGEDG